MLTVEDIDDLLFSIDITIGECYEPINSKDWKDIEEKLNSLKNQIIITRGATSNGGGSTHDGLSYYQNSQIKPIKL